MPDGGLRLVFGLPSLGTARASVHPQAGRDDARRHEREEVRPRRTPLPRAKVERPASRRVARRAGLLGDQIYADQPSPGTMEYIESRRDPEHPPGVQTSRSTRACTGTPGRTRSPGGSSQHPLGHDLRRPRRPRRLEHLGGVGAGDALQVLVGGAGHRGVHVLLGLPAPRQPVPGGAGDDSSSRGFKWPATRPACCASSRTRRTGRSETPAGATTATSGTRA